MGRGAFAFRDLDEELHAFVADEGSQYAPHMSPPDVKSKSATSKRTLNGLSESTMLKLYVDHHKAQRRRKLLGGALFLGVAVLGIAPMLMEMQVNETESALELALSAPYRSMRLRGEADPAYDPLAQESDDETQWISEDANVGDVDPHDVGVGGEADTSFHVLVDGDASVRTLQPATTDDEDEGDEATQDDAPLDSLDTEDEQGQTLTDTKRLRVGANDDQEDDDADDKPSAHNST